MRRYVVIGIILLFVMAGIILLHPAKPQHESQDNTTDSYEYYYNENDDIEDEEEESLLPDDLSSILANNQTVPLDLIPSSITVLVNRVYLLPADFTPPSLVIPDVKFSFGYISDKRKMRKVAATALERMFNAAEKEGIELYGVSGYRSYARQKEIYDRNIAARGQAATDAVSAKPGSSEHQTGLTIDVSAKSVGYRLDQSFGDTKEGKWLAENAHLYGYIIRYPYEKSKITGYSYEPWHIRFVGTTVATYLYENELTLEEYYGVDNTVDVPDNAVDVEDPDTVKYATPKPRPTRRPSPRPDSSRSPRETDKPKNTKKPKSTKKPKNTKKPDTNTKPGTATANPAKPTEKPANPQPPTNAPEPTRASAPSTAAPSPKDAPTMGDGSSQGGSSQGGSSQDSPSKDDGSQDNTSQQ